MGGGVRTITTARRASRWPRRWRRAATCCSTSTGKARSNCAKKPEAIWSASSSCRRRSGNWSGGCIRAPRTTKSVIRQRMSKASEEMSHWAEYDYVVVNKKLWRAFARTARDPDRRASEARAPARPVEFRAQAAGPASTPLGVSAALARPAKILASATKPSTEFPRRARSARCRLRPATRAHRRRAI